MKSKMKKEYISTVHLAKFVGDCIMEYIGDAQQKRVKRKVRQLEFGFMMD